MDKRSQIVTSFDNLPSPFFDHQKDLRGVIDRLKQAYGRVSPRECCKKGERDQVYLRVNPIFDEFMPSSFDCFCEIVCIYREVRSLHQLQDEIYRIVKVHAQKIWDRTEKTSSMPKHVTVCMAFECREPTIKRIIRG